MLLKISMRLFGGLVRPYLIYFEDLSTSLKRGMIRLSTQEYVSMIMFLTSTQLHAKSFGGYAKSTDC